MPETQTRFTRLQVESYGSAYSRCAERALSQKRLQSASHDLLGFGDDVFDYLFHAFDRVDQACVLAERERGVFDIAGGARLG